MDLSAKRNNSSSLWNVWRNLQDICHVNKHREDQAADQHINTSTHQHINTSTSVASALALLPKAAHRLVWQIHGAIIADEGSKPKSYHQGSTNNINIARLVPIRIGVNITAFERKLTLFLAPFRFPAFFCVFRVGKKCALRARTAERQVELRRLGNKHPVFGEDNSLCEVGNTSLQPGTSMILKLCIS